MYKDKDRQKEADKLRQQRRRDKIKAKGVTITGRDEGVTEQATSKLLQDIFGLPVNFGLADCECKQCQAVRVSGHKLSLNHGIFKPASELTLNELNRVSLPGDCDYTDKAGTETLKRQEARLNKTEQAVIPQPTSLSSMAANMMAEPVDRV